MRTSDDSSEEDAAAERTGLLPTRSLAPTLALASQRRVHFPCAHTGTEEASATASMEGSPHERDQKKTHILHALLPVDCAGRMQLRLRGFFRHSAFCLFGRRRRTLLGALLGCGLLLLILLGFGGNFPRHTAAAEADMMAQFVRTMSGHEHDASSLPAQAGAPSQQPLRFPVMSFNVRFEASPPPLHLRNSTRSFAHRLPLITRLFDRVRPWLVGLQEPLVPQMAALQEALPERYRVIAVDPTLHHLHPPGVFETKVAILYNSQRLLLRENDYVWCSETPRVADSKSWGSWGIRSVNIARFVVRDTNRTASWQRRDMLEEATPTWSGQDASEVESESGGGAEILFFNTHLDHGSERARQKQSDLLARLVDEWHRRYPTASVIVTGDFNSVAGQPAHRTLLRSGLRDAMDTCKEAAAQAAALDAAAASATSPADASALSAAASAAADVYCTDVALSFHGWSGVRYLNSYVGRAVLGVAFTLSSWGWSVPPHFGDSVREWCRSLYTTLSQGPAVALIDAVPQWPWHRLHVDWILFREGEWEAQQRQPAGLVDSAPAAAASRSASPLRPSHSLRVLFVSLLEVRSDEFVSDHFPLVAVFEMAPS